MRYSRVLSILFGLSIFSVAALALATGSYFEFAPKLSDPLDIDSQAGEVYEILYLQNDHISGIDFWLANPGSPGDLSFGLRRDGAATLLGSDTVTVPTLSPTFEGTRTRIDFGYPIPVAANTRYAIRLLSEAPEISVYKALSRGAVLEHNRPYTSEYVPGVARVGDEEREYGFKFALYETAEAVPPIISNATTTVLDFDEAKLRWNANEPVDYRIEYSYSGGTTNVIDWSGEYTLCTEAPSPCEEVLAVVPDKLYIYLLVVRDEWGNVSEKAGAFASLTTPGEAPVVVPPQGEELPPPDTVPPVLGPLITAFIGTDWLKVYWYSGEPADSYLKVTSDSSGQNIVTSAVSSVYEYDHVLQTPPVLAPNRTYYAFGVSKDPSGNIASNSVTFKTLGETATSTPLPPPSPPPPVPPAAEPPAEPESQANPELFVPPGVEIDFLLDDEIGAGSGSFTIRWNAPAAGDPSDGYRVDIFDESNNLVRQVTVPRDAVRELTVRGLGAGKYRILIYSNNGGIFERIAEPIDIEVRPDPAWFALLKRSPFVIIPGLLIAALIFYFIKRERVRLAEETEL